MNLKDHIREVSDFPSPGILFYDISTLLAHPKAWEAAMTRLTESVRPMRPDILIGIESRGFLAAAPLALRLGLGFAMIRKKGKLPGTVIGHEYQLEYGTDTIEIQEGAVQPGRRVVILDDLLATGGTMAASCGLVDKIGGVVAGAACIIELAFLNGREKIDGVPFESLIAYDS